jgi:hypothetical protein
MFNDPPATCAAVGGAGARASPVQLKPAPGGVTCSLQDPPGTSRLSPPPGLWDRIEFCPNRTLAAESGTG